MRTVRFQNNSIELQVGKILCLGRNYAEHAREMGDEPPALPGVFLKPSTALIPDGGTVIIPPFSHDLHHEVEMVVVVGKQCRHVPRTSALAYVAGYAVGLDMTLRDVQSEAKKAGLPWTVSKGFDTSAPVSRIVETSRVADPHNLAISLSVNGSVRQKSSTSKMIFTVDEIISHLSSIFTLEPGDLIFTGTPEGVGRVNPGDRLEAELESVGTLRVRVEADGRRADG